MTEPAFKVVSEYGGHRIVRVSDGLIVGTCYKAHSPAGRITLADTNRFATLFAAATAMLDALDSVLDDPAAGNLSEATRAEVIAAVKLAR